MSQTNLQIQTDDDIEKVNKAQKIVNEYAILCGAAGIIPVPFLDSAVILGLQLRMIQRMGSEVYNEPVPYQKVTAAIASLTASLGSVSVGKSLGNGFLKSIPGIGNILSNLIVPGIAAATTYALGQIFIMHFQSGGTLLTLNPKAHIAKMNELVNQQLMRVQAKKTEAPITKDGSGASMNADSAISK